MPLFPPPMTDESKEAVKAATEETRALPDAAVRDRVIQLGFGGDRARFDQFVAALREVLPPDVTVVLRGSAVTGRRWRDGAEFDSDGPGTSDLDLTFVGGGLLDLWSEFHIPGLHSVPLGEDHPDCCPTFLPLRRALCAMAGRPVNIQATTNLVQYTRDVLLDQPCYTLIEGNDEPAARRAWERELLAWRRRHRRGRGHGGERESGR